MNPYCQLAKDAIFSLILKNEKIKIDTVPKELLNQKAGIFVSIHTKRELRGCIGTFLPTKNNLAEEIISSAISACQDPRFLPIDAKELPFLSFEVYILDEPRIIKDINELDPKKYGILVQSKNKSGLLLPDLEGVNTTEQQIEIASGKAGINLDKENILIYKFSAKKYVSD